MSDPLRIIQLSDMHLVADPEGSLLGVKTNQSFQEVLQLLDEQPIDLIILSGDNSQDGSKQTYIRLAELLAPFKVPVLCVPGNHDNPHTMWSTYPLNNIRADKQFIIKEWQFILLNTQKPGAVEGYLAKDQLEHLQHCLSTNPNHHTIIVFHHHPMPVGSVWLDRLDLTNAPAFWSIVTNHSQVKSILFGHVHQEFARVMHGIECYSAPSTCIQFKPKQVDFALDNIPQGYRSIVLFADGRIETEVKRTKEYVGIFDENAQGY